MFFSPAVIVDHTAQRVCTWEVSMRIKKREGLVVEEGREKELSSVKKKTGGKETREDSWLRLKQNYKLLE